MKKRRWPVLGQRRRAETMADRLADRMVIPQPFSHEAYQEVLSEAIGIPIRLVPLSGAVPDASSVLTGMTVRLFGVSYLFYPADTSPVHQLHVIHHELFHVIDEHAGIELEDPMIKSALVSLLRPELPHLSGDLIDRLVGRNCPTGHAEDQQERDAEKFAMTMARRMGVTSPSSGPSSDEPEADQLDRWLSDGRS
ncbi:hypothetical protein [Amycolatopsis sp. NPDC059657]|uniref:hypothetical protein n=1 Tax=Amycolatopsis sp. NPDC059657 TaxID=3346899 RepID=UPI00366A7384